MTDQIDPQVTASIIGATATLFGGGAVGRWFGRRSRSSQDQRCERVCASMVNMAKTMLAVMEALGVDDHRLAPHISQMKTQMAEAEAYLNGSGSL